MQPMPVSVPTSDPGLRPGEDRCQTDDQELRMLCSLGLEIF